MSAIAIATLLDEATCYACYAPGSVPELAKLALLSRMSQSGPVIPPPSAPGALAGNRTGTTSLDANWTASVGATSYQLDVFTDFLMTTFVAGFNNLNVGNVVTYSVTGLTIGTPYYYRVRAVNAGGASANSSRISIGTTPAPGDVVTVNNNTTITLNTKLLRNGVNFHNPGNVLPSTQHTWAEGGLAVGFTITVQDNNGVLPTGVPVAGLLSGGVFFWE